MSYEYMLGIGAEDDDVFELGVQVAPLPTKKSSQAPGSQQAQKGRISRQEKRRQTQAACGGMSCPEGIGQKTNFVTNDPVRVAEIEEAMIGQGCSSLCTVGNSYTYCCPSTIQMQEVVTDPFATDPMMLDVVETSIAITPTEVPAAVTPVEEGDSSRLGFVAIFGVLGLGMAGVIGFLALRKKRKKKKGKKKS